MGRPFFFLKWGLKIYFTSIKNLPNSPRNVLEIFFLKIGSVKATNISTRDPKGGLCKHPPPHPQPRRHAGNLGLYVVQWLTIILCLNFPLSLYMFQNSNLKIVNTQKTDVFHTTPYSHPEVLGSYGKKISQWCATVTATLRVHGAAISSRCLVELRLSSRAVRYIL